MVLVCHVYKYQFESISSHTLYGIPIAWKERSEQCKISGASLIKESLNFWNNINN